MTEKLKQVVKREMAKLPRENQTVINTSGWEQIVEEIGKKHLFNDVELNDLQVQTLLILIGLEDLDFYAKNIENEVGTSKNEAEKIAEEVIQKIFTPINDILIENIKKSDRSKNPNAEQTLNFILSGGDYSAFVEVSPLLSEEGVGGGNSKETPPRPSGTPPQKGGEETKSRFTI